MNRSPATTAVSGASRAGGAVLAAGASTLGHVLDRIKPLHPTGTLREATVSVVGSSAPRSGVAWIDEPADHRALVRLSRAIGLPQPLPDIAGLALRLDLPAGPADLLFASTGTGSLGRFVLTFRRPGRTGALTSLLPYRSPTGPLHLCALPRDERTHELLWAHGTGPWRTFALVHLGAERDEIVSFDPVLNLAPGLAQYSWVRRLREPAYHAARAQSDRTDPAG